MPSLGKAFIEVRADLSTFATEVRAKLKAALEEGSAGVEFTGVEEAAGRAGEEAGRRIEEGVKKTGEPGGDRAGKSIGSRIVAGISSTFGAIVPTLLPILIALAVEAVAALGPAIAALSFGIPAAVGLAVASMAVLKIATNGVGDALKAAFSGNQAAFDKAMQKLAPAAREFVVEVQKIRPLMHSLQQDIQQTFFVQFRGTLLDVVHAVLPELRAGLHSVAGDLGQMVKSLGGALSGGKSDIQSILIGVHQALVPLIPAFGQFVRMFLTLGAVGGPFLATMSQRFADLLTRLSAFVEKLADSGRLSQIFDEGLAVLSELGRLIGNVWNLLTSLMNALQSSGADAIGLVSSLVGQLAAFFATAQGQQDLSAIFSLLNTALNALSSILQPLLPVIGQLAGDLSDQLIAAVIALTPSLVNVSKALADILTGIDPLLPAIGQLVTGISPILNWLTQNPGLLAGAAIAWAGLTAAEWAATAAMTAFDAAADANPIGLVIIAIAAIVAGIVLLVQNWKTVKQWGSDAWNAIKDAGVAVWHWMEGVGTDISNWFQGVMDWFSALPGNIETWLASIPDKIATAFQDAFDAAGRVIGFAVGLIIGEFVLFPGQLWDAIKSIGHLIGDLFKDAWDWATKTISTGWDNASRFFSELPGRISDFISSVPGMLRDKFHQAWEWVKKEVSDGSEAVVDFARKLPGRIEGFFDNVGHTILNGLKSGINSVIDSFNHGIDEAAGWTHISLPHIPRLAKGGIIDQPTLAMIGEGGKREVVVPTDNPARAQQLLEQSGLMGTMRTPLPAGIPTINFTAYLGTGQLLEVLDTRVDMHMDQQATDLTYGVRQGGY